MIPPPIPSDDEARLAAIAHYRLGGPGSEPAFDHATDLAARTFDVPISLVSIVGSDEQCFKGIHGLDAQSTSRDVSFCGYVLLERDVMVVEDALEDARFHDNPLVQGDPQIRFYAGAPLRLKDGLIPGTLCLIDRKPRVFTAGARAELAALAKLVVDIIELRLDGIMAEDRHQALTQLQDDFISTTSHELRTPLASISGALALLKGGAAGDVPERARRLIDIAHTNSQRLIRLVNDILDIGKLAAGSVEFDIRPIPVATMLEDAIQTNSSYAAGHQVTLALAPADEGLAVLADQDRLSQVLTNLVANAVKFSPPGATVTLGAHATGRGVRLFVADRGRGIPDAFRSRIFTRFAQAEATDAREKGGTGLGLAIVQEIVTRMGGEVGFESVLGEGSTFHVDLPRA